MIRLRIFPVRLSLRWRLTMLYTTIVAATLASFGYLNFSTVSRDLNSNLDSSILQVAQSLDYIIRQKLMEINQPLKPLPLEGHPKKIKEPASLENLAFFQKGKRLQFIGPIRPSEPEPAKEKAEIVWSAVYEHILLNPKNYFIQVANENDQVVWRSDNLAGDTLPLPSTVRTAADGAAFSRIIPDFYFAEHHLRVMYYATPTVQITVGYPVEEIQSTLRDLFSTLVFSLPGVLLISVLGGWFLGRYSFRPIDAITLAAKEITANNLSQRLPKPPVNDEIARLTATLNEMIERLETSFQQIKQFTGDASHELRTPLAILMGELEIALRSRKTAEEYQDTISSALDEVVRLSQVIDHLLELSRAESGQYQLAVGIVNLSNLIQDIAEDAMILAEEKGITVECETEDGMKIFGDKARLHQAFLNVIENAIKYTPEGGFISITVQAEHDSAIISISDSGFGIPPEDIPHIFDRFYRVDKARSQKIRGHGLGLSIVKQIIEAHHGSISVESEVGKGSRFLLRLPLDMLGQKTALTS